MLTSLARRCVRRRRLILAGWAVVLGALVTLAVLYPGRTETDFSLPGSESQAAADLLDRAGISSSPTTSGSVVVAADDVRAPETRGAVENLVRQIADAVPQARVDNPYAEQSQGHISPDGTVAYADLDLGSGPDDEVAARADQVEELREAADTGDLRVELAGEPFVQEAPGGMAEGIGVLAAVVILLFAFGSVIAMALPILIAVVGVGAGASILLLLQHVVPVPSFAVFLTIMLGLGVGIDYALLVVTRYRTSLSEGLEPEQAVIQAMNTAGRSVLFAGTTVVIAILGMLFMGLEVGGGLAIAGGLGVLMVMLAAVSLLPAMLGVVGRRIDRFGLPHRHRNGATGDGRRTLSYRWSRVVQRRPWPTLVVALLALLLLAAPVLSLRLGNSDAGNRPTSDTTRQAYDLLADGFGPGANGPLVLVAETPDGERDVAAVRQAAGEVAKTPGVAATSPAFRSEDGTVAVVTVFPATSPQDEETTELVHTLRDDVLPVATADSGIRVLVSGVTAGGIDFADVSLERLPWLVGTVLLASFLLLVVVFRSVVVPLKGVAVNVLSIGAAYGVVVAVFQWGWLSELVGIGRNGPTDAWVPALLFAVVFGLSMDYEVFLLSRIREEYGRTRDSGRAVADGLAATARVITAAAAIMICVFAGFTTMDDRALKIMAVGLATAVLVDATLVRMILVPAAMELLGDRNWWLPRFLDRRLPHLDVDGSAIDGTPTPAKELAGSASGLDR